MIELLKNQTAKINKKVMQVIGTNALDETEMHRPLIERSNLSVPTMKRIATFVSAALLETLISGNSLISMNNERRLRFFFKNNFICSSHNFSNKNLFMVVTNLKSHKNVFRFSSYSFST